MAGMKKTPFTAGGLRKYDHMSPEEALVAAWTTAGSHPSWDEARKRELRDGLPLIARHLDRLVEDKKSAKSPVHVSRQEQPTAHYLVEQDGEIKCLVPQAEFLKMQSDLKAVYELAEKMLNEQGQSWNSISGRRIAEALKGKKQ